MSRSKEFMSVCAGRWGKRIGGLAVAVLIGGCAGVPRGGGEVEESGNGLFERREIELGLVDRPTILTGFFSGGEWADVVVIDQGGGVDRRLLMYGWRLGDWQRVSDVPLGADMAFVDVVRAPGRDWLVAYADGKVKVIDPMTGRATALAAVPMRYRRPPGGEVVRVGIARELNGDRRSDLVIPDGEGIRLSLQRADGSFGAPVAYGAIDAASEEPLTMASVPLSLGRVHAVDLNGDGRDDLAFWADGGFEVHLQGRSGSFRQEAQRLEVPASILSGGGGRHGPETRVRLLEDLNGDGVADLVVQSLVGWNRFRQRSEYGIYLGERTGAGTGFGELASEVLKPSGTAGGLQDWGYASQWSQDFDGDGDVDWLFREVRVGAGGVARTLVGQSVPIDLEYRPMVDGRYPTGAARRDRLRRFAPSVGGFGRVFFPAVRVGDVNADRQLDVVIGHAPNELRVFLGEAGRALFVGAPVKIAAELPDDEGKVRLVTINRDERDDLLVHLPPTRRDRGRGHVVALWIANPGGGVGVASR